MTIAAISTAPGIGAIAIVRLSGPQALEIVARCWRGRDLRSLAPRTAHLGYITDSHGDDIDQVLLTIFAPPASFTGELLIEIGCHGSRYIQQAILSRLIDAGATPASPGEFSMRAVINGRLDLTQAEGVADLIASTSRASARIAMTHMKGGISSRLNHLTSRLTDLASLIELELDFSEEDVQFASRSHLLDITRDIDHSLTTLIDSYATGSALRDGIPVAIAGAPNAGKSSLLNAMLADQRAIVSDIPGTTRDTIEDTLIIGQYLIRLTDTAGLRHTTDPIEQAGILRTRHAISHAGILLSIVDTTLTPNPSLIPLPDTPDTPLIILLNKTDSPDTKLSGWQEKLTTDEAHKDHFATAEILAISTRSEADITRLKQKIETLIAKMQHNAGDIILTNERHRANLTEAREAIRRIEATLAASLPMDMLTQDLRQAIEALGVVTGTAITTPTLLHHLFSHFCIGK